MDDTRIIDLFWERSEDAIAETSKKYGRYCLSIAYTILQNNEDSEECVNDTWIRAWGAMPPHRPYNLPAFLAKITRNLSLDRCRRDTADKRGAGRLRLALEELADCVPASYQVEQIVDEITLQELLNSFLGSLTQENRKIFMRRYWYMSTVKEIADEYGLTESKVKMSLLRSRRQLKKLLQKEGVTQ